jgi:hypothetical protein
MVGVRVKVGFGFRLELGLELGSLELGLELGFGSRLGLGFGSVIEGDGYCPSSGPELSARALIRALVRAPPSHSALANPRKVAPPHAVPPTRTKRVGESTLRIYEWRVCQLAGR